MVCKGLNIYEDGGFDEGQVDTATANVRCLDE